LKNGKKSLSSKLGLILDVDYVVDHILYLKNSEFAVSVLENLLTKEKYLDARRQAGKIIDVMKGGTI
jgi:hypothetical protein